MEEVGGLPRGRKQPKTARRAAALLSLAGTALVLGAWAARPAARGEGVAAAAAAPVAGEEKLIALTFDDGPSAANTPVLLDGLKQRGVRATFFLVGSMVEGHPELAVRLAREGHQLGIHTYNHDPPNGLRGLSEAQFDAQVGVTRRMLTALTGQTEFALRPPYGFLDEGVERQAPGPIILWSVDPEDWRYRNTEKVTAHILSHVQDGDIVLLHDIFPTSVEAALRVVDALQSQGWRFVTVDELLALRGVELQRGESCHSVPPRTEPGEIPPPAAPASDAAALPWTAPDELKQKILYKSRSCRYNKE